eukprot:Seg4002.3 transcript_id=Seg4002.3/GoldUCD/mRNA.D3Y31 product="hypothetical protein" protein_id=Seg4002.3/GoldUCD/D3Y31
MESPPCHATCIYDGMATIRASSPAVTWGQYMSDQLKAFTPPASWYAKEIVVVFDNYIDDQEYSIKEAERLERVCSPRVHLGSNDQQMIGGKDFQRFIHNKENNDELIKRFNDFAEHPGTRSHLKVPLTINHRNRTKKITMEDVDVTVECNHEEADTRVVLHAFNSDCSRNSNKAKRYGHRASDDIAFALRNLKLFGASNDQKVVVFVAGRNIRKTLDEDGDASVTKFIHETIYSGKRDDDLVTTRMRQYDKVRVKTTQSIIPDPESIKNLIQRANMAAYYLKAFRSPVIEKIDSCESG